MKKVLFVFALLAAGAIGFAVYRTATECDREYEKYRNTVSLIDRHRFSTSSPYQWEVLQDLRKKQDDLLDICFDKRHMHIAIEMLESLIRDLNGPQYVFDRRLPRNSAQVKLVSIYYRKLAAAYEVQGDRERNEQALKNAQKYEAEAARMRD
jgi:hypothetical protein